MDSETAKFIAKENMAASLAFVRGPLWADMRRALMARRPAAASANEAPHEAAARGFQRASWEAALDELELLLFEQPKVEVDPFNRPAVTETKD